jgi:hypothetical protein
MPIDKRIIADYSNDNPPVALTSLNAKATKTLTFSLPAAITITAQVVVASTSGSGSRSIWTLTVSNDGTNFSAFPVPVTVTAGGITDVQDMTGYLYLRLVNTTLSTYTTETVNVIIGHQN